MSQETSLSMLAGLKAQDARQWQRFVDLYSALVYEWCRRFGLQQNDAADVVQETFKAVALSISQFQRDREGGTFHGWLYGINRFKVLDFFRSQQNRAQAIGGSNAQQMLNNMPDWESQVPAELSEEQVQQETQALYHKALQLIQTEFEPKTWQAFMLVAVEERSPADVAEQLQMTKGAVYNAKYKVLNRLKTEFEGLL